MLSFEDCVALCGLSREEIDAIAEHEHVPAIVAAELGNYLIHTKGGVPMIKAMIVEDIEHAVRHGNRRHAEQLQMVLRHFIATHPLARPLAKRHTEAAAAARGDRS